MPLIRASTVADANLVPTAAPAMALAALRLPAPRTAATRCSPWMIDIDGERAHPAMVDNDLLGGCTSFGVDRALTAQLAAAVPDVGEMARAGRAFLRHAVRYLVASGIQQFLDIGCGLATPGCVHHLALRSAPSARVVCVDIDPIVVVHNERALAGNPHAAVLHADARQPDMILNHPTVNAVLDFGDPVAVMLLSTLDLVRDDEDPHGIVARLRDTLRPGSYLAISHLTADSRPGDIAALAAVARAAGIETTARTRSQIENLFTGFDLVEPGLVWATQWHPDNKENNNKDNHTDEPPQRCCVLAGIGRKPPTRRPSSQRSTAADAPRPATPVVAPPIHQSTPCQAATHNPVTGWQPPNAPTRPGCTRHNREPAGPDPRGHIAVPDNTPTDTPYATAMRPLPVAAASHGAAAPAPGGPSSTRGVHLPHPALDSWLANAQSSRRHGC